MHKARGRDGTDPLVQGDCQRARRADLAFRDALLAEAVDALRRGEVDVGVAILRDYVDAMVGAAEAAPSTNTPQR
jgi:hypothetical protein